jgi:hypothetical protein
MVRTGQAAPAALIVKLVTTMLWTGGTALARTDRHPVPPRQARRPDHHAQYVGRILRSHENKTTAEVHDYLDERTGVLAAMLTKRAPGYAGLGFPDPRRLTLTSSASPDS